MEAIGFLCLILSQNHRITEWMMLGRTSRDLLVQYHCSGTVTQSMLPRTPSHWVLNMPTTSLRNLF